MSEKRAPHHVSPRPWRVIYGELHEVVDAEGGPVATFILSQDAETAVEAANIAAMANKYRPGRHAPEVIP